LEREKKEVGKVERLDRWKREVGKVERWKSVKGAEVEGY